MTGGPVERPRARLLRRTISISILLVTFALGALAAPILVPLAALVDVAQGRRFALARMALMMLAYLGYEVAGVARALALHGRRGERALDDNFRLQWWWCGRLFDAATALFALRVEVRGVEEAARGPVIVLSRHTSVGDVLLAAALVSRAVGLRLRYVLKRELLWDPCLDIVGCRLPNAFVQRGSRDTAGDVAAVRKLAEGLGPRDGVLIFPEGTRATPALRARALAKLDASPSVSAAQRDAARRLQHLLPPRVEGVLALLDAAPETDVVLLAHSGFDHVRTLADLRRGTLVGRRIHVHLERCPRAEIPEDRDGRLRWLLAAWQRVDDRVAALHADDAAAPRADAAPVAG